MSHAIVIGSGIAGIAAALRVRHMGYEVDIFEANSYPGGKIHNLKLEGYRFDTGPSLFTLPHLVDELFTLYGDQPRDYFRYIQKDSICNYFWEDGTRFAVSANPEHFIDQACQVFECKPEVLRKYLDESQKKYELTSGIFLQKSLHKLSTYISKDTLKSLLRIHGLGINQSLHTTNSKTFNDKRLVQLFNRYATYNGSSPYKTPGIMSMIPHLEMHHGTFLPIGGMQAISQSLFEYALTKGVRFHFNQPVNEILVQDKRAIGIKTQVNHFADLIVSNADVFTSYRDLLPSAKSPNRILNQERSSSALIFYWGIKGSFPELDLHNIFFSQDYQSEFETLFEKKSVYVDPTIYINITSKEEASDAPPGHENWFVMINTPGNFGQDWDELIQEARNNIIKKISSNLNTEIEPLIQCEAILDPRKIEEQTRSHRGALYGTSSNSRFAAFLRHPNFTSRIKNLYFCGGSVHPGGGIPLCLLSAKIVANLIKAA